jgi:inulin fructotransferase (DFA-I-forming)
MAPTVYDVTTWPGATVSPYTDIGMVINEIMADVHATQTTNTTRPGAVIYIPPGHYTLQTTANIDASFITIKGSGHGFIRPPRIPVFTGFHAAACRHMTRRVPRC